MSPGVGGGGGVCCSLNKLPILGYLLDYWQGYGPYDSHIFY
jgi:hypothetical protein